MSQHTGKDATGSVGHEGFAGSGHVGSFGLAGSFGNLPSTTGQVGNLLAFVGQLLFAVAEVATAIVVKHTKKKNFFIIALLNC